MLLSYGCHEEAERFAAVLSQIPLLVEDESGVTSIVVTFGSVSAGLLQVAESHGSDSEARNG